MKRTFGDLHLHLNGKGFIHGAHLARKAAELGYRLIAAPLAPETKSQEIQHFKTAFANEGIDFAARVDLQPRTQNELLCSLRRLRRKFEVICVLCTNKEVARQAAKDRRVDLLNFPLCDYRRRFFDHAEAELASTGVAEFEVDIKPLLILQGSARVRLLSYLRREINLCSEFHVPVVVSSGVSRPLLLRKPREMALLSSLFGLPNNSQLDSVSLNPVKIVERNRKKLKKEFIAPEIRLVKQGENQ